jgi:hypothetical protein
VKPVMPYANVDGHGIDDRDRELGVCKEMMLRLICSLLVDAKVV